MSTKNLQSGSHNTILEFRRRHSTFSSSSQEKSSIILCSSIFRRNFRPSSLQVGDYTRMGNASKFIIEIYPYEILL